MVLHVCPMSKNNPAWCGWERLYVWVIGSIRPRSPTSPEGWTVCRGISETPKSDTDHICSFYASAPTAALAGGIMFSGCPSVPFSWPDVLGTPWGNFFSFGINIHLDSRMNWLYFGDQRSRSLWPQIHPILRNAWGNFSTSGTNVHSRMSWLEFGGQRSLWPHKTRLWP